MRGSRDGDDDWYQCRKCGYESPPKYSPAEAVAAWNAPTPTMTQDNTASREARARDVLAMTYDKRGFPRIANAVRAGQLDNQLGVEQCLEAMLALADEAASRPREWPDIGVDPMKGPRSDRLEQSIAACREAYVRQQQHVPDQTALVWRWHLGALLVTATRLKALLARDDTAPTDQATGADFAQVATDQAQGGGEVERLQEALRPFAAPGSSDQYIASDASDDGWCAARSFTAGNYRRARAALAQSGDPS